MKRPESRIVLPVISEAVRRESGIQLQLQNEIPRKFKIPFFTDK